MFIAGDIGGTKTLLAICDSEDSKKNFLYKEQFHSKDYPSLQAILLEFLKRAEENNILLETMPGCFAIPGPAKAQKIILPNLPWEIDIQKLLIKNIEKVYLINDLEANAYGIEVLPNDAFHVLRQGNESIRGNKAVISPGTGLGEAGILWDGKRYLPFATEGGHADFAPKDELTMELLRYLRSKFGHVSIERVLCGPGLFNIYQFLRDEKKMQEPKWLSEEIAMNDPPAIISQHALKEGVAICDEALRIFLTIFGAEAGNLALRFIALGGIYLGGGISPKILPKLKEHTFFDAFVDKGRMKSLLEEIPIQVILDEATALKGAAAYCRIKTIY